MAPDLHSLSKAEPALRSGDFDGDGRVDQLYLVTEPDSGRVAVHIRLNTASGPRDVRVTSMDVAANAVPNLRVVPAGAYAADCGTYSSDCDSAPVQAQHDSVIVSLDGTATVLVHWSGARFEQDFVKSSDSLLAHAVDAMYAVNP